MFIEVLYNTHAARGLTNKIPLLNKNLINYFIITTRYNQLIQQQKLLELGSVFSAQVLQQGAEERHLSSSILEDERVVVGRAAQEVRRPHH